MSIKQKMLETDFPLSGGNPKMRRSSSTKEPPLNAPPLNRQNSGSARKISGYSADPREPLMASEWQYESARSMSRIQTSFDKSGPVSTHDHSTNYNRSVSRDQGVQANLPTVKARQVNPRTASLNRTASLRKACSDESSDIEDEDDLQNERSPLRKPSANENKIELSPVQTPSSTSDYHSDEIHQHRRTNSFHGGTAARLSQSTNPVAVESNPVKWQSLR
jgi:hypothetical protein